MKKCLFAQIVIFCLLFSSCSSSNNNDEMALEKERLSLEREKLDFERQKLSSKEVETDIKVKKVEKSKPVMNCKAAYRYLLGKWNGTLRDKKLAVVIESIDGNTVTGYNIVGNNKRPLNGRIYPSDLEGDGECLYNGDIYKLVLSEPGDNKWDGVFKIYLGFCTYENDNGEVEGTGYNGYGDWKSNSGSKSGEVNLSKN